MTLSPTALLHLLAAGAIAAQAQVNVTLSSPVSEAQAGAVVPLLCRVEGAVRDPGCTWMVWRNRVDPGDLPLSHDGKGQVFFHAPARGEDCDYHIRSTSREDPNRHGDTFIRVPKRAPAADPGPAAELKASGAPRYAWRLPCREVGDTVRGRALFPVTGCWEPDAVRPTFLALGIVPGGNPERGYPVRLQLGAEDPDRLPWKASGKGRVPAPRTAALARRQDGTWVVAVPNDNKLLQVDLEKRQPVPAEA